MSDAKTEWIVRVLGVTLVPSTPTFSLVKLQKARLGWDVARRNALAEVAALARDLHAAVLAHNEDDKAPDEYEEDDLEAGVALLNDTVGALDERLLDALDNALNAGVEERPRHMAAARTVLGEFRGIVGSNRLLAALDSNGFRPCTVRSDLDAALKTVADAL